MPLTCLRPALVSSAFLLAAALLGGCGSSSQVVSTPLSVGGSASAATLGSAYSSAIAVSGGTAPYSCQLGSGSALPAGLALGGNCNLAGTPTATGTYSFSVSATDNSQPVRTGSGTVTLTVNPPTLVVPNTTLTTVINTTFSGTIAVSGGTAPYTCALASGSLPAGLTLSSKCTVSGTATAAGSASLTVKATDSAGTPQTATGTVTINVLATGAQVKVMAGSLPIVGASVQMYAAGTTGNGSAPTALLSAPAVTDATGSVVMNPANYTCPQNTAAVVYLVATGGQAGTNPLNNGTVLMSSPGACTDLPARRTLVLNEASTVASAYAFAPFLSAGAKIGATATNGSGMNLAFGTLNNLVDVRTGTMPGPGFPAPNATAPTEKLNVLARVLNACITGSVTGACTTLYNMATPQGVANAPTNTLDAVMNLAHNPGLDTATLFALAQSVNNSGYDPIPANKPADWMLVIPITGAGLHNPGSISIDSQGRVWVANYWNSNGTASLFNNNDVPVFPNGISDPSLITSYGGAVDANDNFWMANEMGGPLNLGTITVFSPSGTISLGSPFTQGGLNFPISVAFDTDGSAWIADFGDSSVTLLDKTGTPLSGPNGFTSSSLSFPTSIAVDSLHQAWVANVSSNVVARVTRNGTFTSFTVGSGPAAVAVDMNNNVWSGNYYGDSIGMISSAGNVLAPAVTGGGVLHPQGIAIDGANRAWIANYRGMGISEFSAISGNTPGQPISPAAGWAPDAGIVEGFGIAIDAAGDVWVSGFGSNMPNDPTGHTLYEFIGAATPVKTPHVGPVTLP